MGVPCCLSQDSTESAYFAVTPKPCDVNAVFSKRQRILKSPLKSKPTHKLEVAHFLHLQQGNRDKIRHVITVPGRWCPHSLQESTTDSYGEMKTFSSMLVASHILP